MNSFDMHTYTHVHIYVQAVCSVGYLALQEFHPYVFQIFAQLIELHPKELPAFYMSTLFQPLLAPMFWERAGNVPALCRLMQVQTLCYNVI